MKQLSTGEWILLAILSVVWAALGYRLSENDRKTLGRTPWGLPSALWAFFWFLSLIVGLVLYLIAHAGEVRRAQQNPPPFGVPGGTAPHPTEREASVGRALSVADQFPAYPRPANSRPTLDETAAPEPSNTSEPPGTSDAHSVHSVPTVPTALSHPAAQVPSSLSPPAWHPDPSGRFHFRWWDGHQWTSQVSTDGHHLIDTNPDQRIGPY